MPVKNHNAFTLFFNVKKIKFQSKVYSAIKHNKRVIQAELGAWSHIDASKIGLNYSIGGSSSHDEIYQRLLTAIRDYNLNHTRKIRHDAVLAIEAVFSLSPDQTRINFEDYFDECLIWCKKEFGGCELLSADVHLDEASPHMHVLMCCVRPDALIGSQTIGFAKDFRARNLRFYEEVGMKYGLEPPRQGLCKKDRKKLAHDVMLTLQSQNDPLMKSKCFDAIRKAIDANPMSFAALLGVQIEPILSMPKKLRTVAQIMTSKGKGKSWEDSET